MTAVALNSMRQNRLQTRDLERPLPTRTRTLGYRQFGAGALATQRLADVIAYPELPHFRGQTMRVRLWLCLTGCALACSLPAAAQALSNNNIVAQAESAVDPSADIAKMRAAVPTPKYEDVKSIESIMVAIYKSISGPAGPRDWSRLRSLMMPEARLTASFVDEKGRQTVQRWTVDQFIADFDAPLAANPLYETALVNRVERYGNIAQVFSSYATSSAPGAKPFDRGINSIQLVYDGKRWWVLSLLWDTERPGNLIPKPMGG
jgi:hypothetical protein